MEDPDFSTARDHELRGHVIQGRKRHTVAKGVTGGDDLVGVLCRARLNSTIVDAVSEIHVGAQAAEVGL